MIDTILWELVHKVQTGFPTDVTDDINNETAVKVALQKIKKEIIALIEKEQTYE